MTPRASSPRCAGACGGGARTSRPGSRRCGDSARRAQRTRRRPSERPLLPAGVRVRAIAGRGYRGTIGRALARPSSSSRSSRRSEQRARPGRRGGAPRGRTSPGVARPRHARSRGRPARAADQLAELERARKRRRARRYRRRAGAELYDDRTWTLVRAAASAPRPAFPSSPPRARRDAGRERAVPLDLACAGDRDSSSCPCRTRRRKTVVLKTADSSRHGAGGASRPAGPARGSVFSARIKTEIERRPTDPRGPTRRFSSMETLAKILETGAPDSSRSSTRSAQRDGSGGGRRSRGRVPEEYLSRGGRALVTTHLSASKAFTEARDDAIGAAMEFDERDRPSDVPAPSGSLGRSRALSVAERQGLPRGSSPARGAAWRRLGAARPRGIGRRRRRSSASGRGRGPGAREGIRAKRADRLAARTRAAAARERGGCSKTASPGRAGEKARAPRRERDRVDPRGRRAPHERVRRPGSRESRDRDRRRARPRSAGRPDRAGSRARAGRPRADAGHEVGRNRRVARGRDRVARGRGKEDAGAARGPGAGGGPLPQPRPYPEEDG